MPSAKNTPYARVLIAEDEIATAQAYTYIINHCFKKKYKLQVVGCAHTASQTVRLVKKLHPDIVLLDWYMPGCAYGAGEVVEEYIEKGYTGKTLVFTGASARDVIIDAFACGAHGYIWKCTHAENVAIAMRQILDRDYYFSEWTMGAVKALHSNKRPRRLNPIQKQVLEYMSHGLKNSDIARKLKQDIHFVENRRTEICKQLGANSSPHAIAIAIDKGILPGRLVFNEKEFEERTGPDFPVRNVYYTHLKSKK